MKLKEWARGQGVSSRTALNWFHAGTMPVPARQLPTGTILVDPPQETSGRTVAYCRVSSVDQKDDLQRRAGRVAGECGRRGVTFDATVTDIGSGLNGRRTELATPAGNPRKTTPGGGGYGHGKTRAPKSAGQRRDRKAATRDTL